MLYYFIKLKFKFDGFFLKCSYLGSNKMDIIDYRWWFYFLVKIDCSLLFFVNVLGERRFK